MAIGIELRDLSLPSIDRRTIVGAILAAIAALAVLQLTKPPELTPILVAGSDLAAGRPLEDMDIAVRYVEVSEGLVVGDAIGDLAAWSLRVPLAEGEPLVPSLMQPPEVLVKPNVIALALPSENAVLGRLVAGDKIDVYATQARGIDEAPETVLLAADVYVVEAALSESSVDRGKVEVLLAVDDDLASEIAAASHAGSIDLVRVAP